MIISVYTFIASSLLIGFFLPSFGLKRGLMLIGNYWLGTLLYIILTVLILDVIRLILKRIDFKYNDILFSRRGFVAVGTLCITIIAALSITGIITAQSLHTTDYEITVDKDCNGMEELTVALAADIHLGYNTGDKYMRKMVDEINRMEPDIVVIAGDIFDNEFDALDNPEQIARTLSGIKSRYGVYACYGNHDIKEKILAGFTFGHQKEKASDTRMDAFLRQAGMKLLMDDGILIEDSFYLYGRPDYERPGRGIKIRKTPAEITGTMDKSKPILVIDHEPRELEALAASGVDLDLCGHTHDGQMFPGNLTVRLFFENVYGHLRKGQMHNIVTSGVGVFGPNMRTATKSEVCRIQVHFK